MPSSSVHLDPPSPEKDPMKISVQGSWEQQASDDHDVELRIGGNNSASTHHSIHFRDHYSLGLTPSSTLTFRGRRVQIYDTQREQFLVEQQPDKDDTASIIFTVKHLPSGSFGQSFLRLAYTAVSLLLAGFIFVFLFQIVLFVVMNLPAEAGATATKEVEAIAMAGSFLSLPVFLYGMASALAMATTFAVDMWQGGLLIRSLTGWSIVLREWIAFVLFLGIPTLAAVVTLMSGRENWWEATARVWMVCIFLAQCVFALGVVLKEVSTCWKLVVLMENKKVNDGANGPVELVDAGAEDLAKDETANVKKSDGATINTIRWTHIARQAFLTTQSHRYSGTRNLRFTVSGTDQPVSPTGDDLTSFTRSTRMSPVKTVTGWYTRFSLLSCWEGRIFDRVDPPQRLYTPDEIRDTEPFLTRQNWSLEKMCCRDSHHAHIMAAQGPAALQSSQALSSIVCSSMGSILICLVFISLLVWLDQSAGAIVFMAALLLYCFLWPMVQDSRSLYQTYDGIHKQNDGTKASHIFQLWETVCVTRPCVWFCYATLAIEIGLFFLWPLGSLYVNNSTSLASVFLVIALFSFFRFYFDVSAILAQSGMLTLAELDDIDGSESKALEFQASISEIIGKISKSRSVGRWIRLMSILAIVIYLMFLSVVNSNADVSPSDRPEILVASDFRYPGNPGVAYPTCELSKGVRFEDGADSVQLVDFAFLSALAYETPETTEMLLALWFGPDTVVDEVELVETYRAETGTDRIPVWFKLFTFPAFPGAAIISVRGSETTMDWLVNMQQWAATGLAQVVKYVVPFGWIWEPVLDDLMAVVSVVQSSSLKEISYYKIVARFARDLGSGQVGNRTFDEIRLTGASLGGGTAMIAGAQTDTHTIAISGPGAVLGRQTFEPPVSLEKLNQYAFNVIPDRDYIARLGGRARLNQAINCKAHPNNLFGCHSMWRTLCEISYTCGGGTRPALCMCVERFGYPNPISTTNSSQSIEAVCGL